MTKRQRWTYRVTTSTDTHEKIITEAKRLGWTVAKTAGVLLDVALKNGCRLEIGNGKDGTSK